jgi:predicted O-methyltransferase YrrM
MLVRALKSVVRRCAPGWADRMGLARAARKMVELSSACRTPADHVDLVRSLGRFGMHQVRAEIISLMSLVTDLRPERACEIGTCDGGTLFLLARACHPEARILSMDWEYSPAQLRAFPKFAGPGQTLECLPGDSHSPTTRDRMIEYFRGEKLDFLFIDGDHSYDGVKSDFEMYAPLVRPGGLIAFHDINPDHRSLRRERYEHLGETRGVPLGQGAISGDVPRYWSEIKDRYPGSRELIDVPGQDGAGIGVITWPG